MQVRAFWRWSRLISKSTRLKNNNNTVEFPVGPTEVKWKQLIDCQIHIIIEVFPALSFFIKRMCQTSNASWISLVSVKHKRHLRTSSSALETCDEHFFRFFLTFQKENKVITHENNHPQLKVSVLRHFL